MPAFYGIEDAEAEGIFAFDFSAISSFYSNGTIRHSPYHITETPLDDGYTVTPDDVLLATADRGVVAIDKGASQHCKNNILLFIQMG